METSAAGQRLAARFVAGETLDQALEIGRSLNSQGISLTFDHLGESVTSLAEAAAARDVYLRTLAAIRQAGIRANLSLKLTQLGLDFSIDECRANVEQLVRQAAAADSFVRVDMEVQRLHQPHARAGARSACPAPGRGRGDPGLPSPQPQ